MEQSTLIKTKKKTSVLIKESYGGFEVCHPNHIDFREITPKPVILGKIVVDRDFNSYEEAKKYFEKEVKEAYQTDVEWAKTKHQDQEGCFWLNGIKINWELRTNYISEYHLEFRSKDENKNSIPNLLTETGYRSDFPNLNPYNSVEEYIEDYVDYTINHDYKGKRKSKPIKYNLSWEEDNHKPPKQLNLLNLSKK